eukprot:3648251-Prymnesium_polylepis.1
MLDLRRALIPLLIQRISGVLAQLIQLVHLADTVLRVVLAVIADLANTFANTPTSVVGARTSNLPPGTQAPGLAWMLWYNSSVGFHRSSSAQYRPGPLLQLRNDTPVAVVPPRLRSATGT